MQRHYIPVECVLPPWFVPACMRQYPACNGNAVFDFDLPNGANQGLANRLDMHAGPQYRPPYVSHARCRPATDRLLAVQAPPAHASRFFASRFLQMPHNQTAARLTWGLRNANSGNHDRNPLMSPTASRPTAFNPHGLLQIQMQCAAAGRKDRLQSGRAGLNFTLSQPLSTSSQLHSEVLNRAQLSWSALHCDAICTSLAPAITPCHLAHMPCNHPQGKRLHLTHTR